MLVSGCFLLLLLAVLLIILLCCAWEHFDNSNGHVPGLADDQGITAVSVLLYWTGWNSSVNSSRRDCDLWISPVDVHAGAGHPEASVAVGKSTLEKLHLEISVAVDNSMLHQNLASFLASSHL